MEGCFSERPAAKIQGSHQIPQGTGVFPVRRSLCALRLSPDPCLPRQNAALRLFPGDQALRGRAALRSQRTGQYSVGGPDDRLEASGAGGENSILFKRTSGRKYVSYYHDRRRGTGGRDASPGRGTRSDRCDHLPRFSRSGRSPGCHGKVRNLSGHQ